MINNYRIYILILNIGFSSFIAPGNKSNILSIPLSAQEIASAGSITGLNNSFIKFKNPVSQSSNQRQIGYNFNTHFSNEYNSSIILFPQINANNGVYNFGLIYLSVPNIPDTRNLFSGQNSSIPDYNSISNFSFNQYGVLLNYSNEYNENIKYGVSLIPHFYNLENYKAFGLIYNLGVSFKINANIEYLMILNSLPGSFTIWDKSDTELFPLELKNGLTYKVNNINLFTNLNYKSENISILNSNFWVDNGIDYSLGLKVGVNKNLQLITAHGSHINFGFGFLFKFRGIDIYYGIGNQKLETYSMFHHGIDFIFDLNRIGEWQKLLQP